MTLYNFSDSCHCGDVLGSTVDDSFCNATCEGGAATKKCGGSAYESVYGTGRYFVYYQQRIQINKNTLDPKFL